MIREALGLSASDIITQQDLDTLILLDAENRGIADPEGIQQLRNLLELNLNTNNISDISALQDVTSLQELTLSRNNISDISALYDDHQNRGLYRQRP